jgi:hypothetical protein
MTSASIRHGLALSLMLAIALFYALTIRQGHEWGDDFAMYIHHAENIAAQRPYAATGYIYNPNEASYGPIAYPPMFPSLLAPLVKLYGRNLAAMKMEEVIFFTLALLSIYGYYRRDLPWPYLFALVALIGLNPSFWEAKDSITSDIPFLFFFFLAATLIYSPFSETPSWRPWARSVAVGLALYACCSTRSLGLTLLPGLVLYEVVKYRRLTRLAIFAPALCLLLMVLQRRLFAANLSSYSDQFLPTLHVVLSNAASYFKDLSGIWPRTGGKAVAHLLFGITMAAAGWALYRRGRRAWTPIEAFLPCYLIAILLWPAHQGVRFLFPLIPVYLFYALLGFRDFTLRLGRVPGHAALILFLLLAGISYATEYRRANFGTIPETVGRASFVSLCRYIDGNTAPADIFVFRRPRALSLFADRPAGVYNLNAQAQPDGQWKYFQRIGAKYIVISGLFPDDAEFLGPALQQHAAWVSRVYQNSDFTVYRIDSPRP